MTVRNTAMRDEYITEPKNDEIRQLRELFSNVQEQQVTEAEVAYAQKSFKHKLMNKLNNAAIKDLLAYHWGSYDYVLWKRGMDNLVDLLRLETCQTVYEAGFGSGAPLNIFNDKFPQLGVSGNDFYDPFVQLARNSTLIGNGAFVHAHIQ